MLMFEKIKQVLHDLPIKYVNNDELAFAYDIYLISKGFRPGGFLFDGYNYDKQFYQICDLDFENRYKITSGQYDNFEFTRFTEQIYTLLHKLNTIDNIGVYIGALYDNSLRKDTIYIYNKNNFNNVKKDIEWLETNAYTRYKFVKFFKNRKMAPEITNKRHIIIGKILGYSKISEYNNVYYDGDSYDVDYYIDNIKIYRWSFTKDQFQEITDKYLLLNNLLEPLDKTAELKIQPTLLWT